MKMWSDYIGDRVSGKHIPEKKCYDKDKIVQIYSGKRKMGRNFNLSNAVQNEVNELFSFSPQNNPKNISYEEQIEAQNFWVKCIAPHILYRSFDFATPHIYQEWIDFMMSVPEKIRKHELLFKKILLKQNKTLFSLPVKVNYGLGLQYNKTRFLIRKYKSEFRRYFNKIYPLLPSKMLNYIDFSKAIKKRPDLRQLIFSSLEDLKKRKLIDNKLIKNAWEEYNKGSGNMTNEVIILASLEILLKAGKKLN